MAMLSPGGDFCTQAAGFPSKSFRAPSPILPPREACSFPVILAPDFLNFFWFCQTGVPIN
jgi:hypothetical protein